MNISGTEHCYGCGVCAAACPRGIIDMELDADGFYAPRITDVARCTDCGLCVEVCSWRDASLALPGPGVPLASYAAWSRDTEVRRRCSSGGVGFEVGRALIGRGFKVCGVRYDAGAGRAEHYIAATEGELWPSVGSKYIQSYTVGGFRAIDRKGRYLVTGTPCQIDSFRRYIRKFRCEGNFVLMDFFCHGVPSMRIWQKYIAEVEKAMGRITHVSWRNKFTGWHDSWAMTIDGEKSGVRACRHGSGDMAAGGSGGSYSSRLSQGDAFYRLFLCDQCLGRACYEQCKFKYDKSAADIRIGDLWGNTYAADEEGVSAVAVFTDKGREALEQSGCELKPETFATVAEGQMKAPPRRDRRYGILARMARNETATTAAMTAVLDRHERLMRLTYPFRHPLRMARNIVVKRLGLTSRRKK